jgi:uncharacterized spore protein YtfJ
MVYGCSPRCGWNGLHTPAKGRAERLGRMTETERGGAVVGEMRVDLSELEETVRKLGRVTTAMGDSVTKSQYNTFLPKNALGKGFAEQTDIDNAHTEMKSHIEEIIKVIHEVIDDFGTKTKQAHGKYQNAEHDAKYGMDGGRSGSGN